MSVASVETRLDAPYNIDATWTARDSVGCQALVEDFLNLLNTGQLRKGEHDKLVEKFVNWVQQDPFWNLALPVAPEFREGTIQNEQQFPKGDTKDLFHPKEIIDMVERIHRPLTEEESKEKEEWEQLWKESGATIVGSPEWYEKMKEEHGSEFGSHRPGDGGGVPGFWVAGEPMLLGDVLKAGKKGNGS
ncbi:MAG: hypothetical protein Q9192_008033 [Flavoplaca navasiana]